MLVRLYQKNFIKCTIGTRRYNLTPNTTLTRTLLSQTLTLTLTLTRNRCQADITLLRAYETREDIESYGVILKKVFRLFGEAIHESLTRTLGQYLEATGGKLANSKKKQIGRRILLLA